MARYMCALIDGALRDIRDARTTMGPAAAGVNPIRRQVIDPRVSRPPSGGAPSRTGTSTGHRHAEAVRAHQPSDMLYEVLDQEMRELAETARDLLPPEQWDRLRNATKEELQRKIQDPGPGA